MQKLEDLRPKVHNLEMTACTSNRLDPFKLRRNLMNPAEEVGAPHEYCYEEQMLIVDPLKIQGPQKENHARLGINSSKNPLPEKKYSISPSSLAEEINHLVHAATITTTPLRGLAVTTSAPEQDQTQDNMEQLWNAINSEEESEQQQSVKKQQTQGEEAGQQKQGSRQQQIVYDNSDSLSQMDEEEMKQWMGGEPDQNSDLPHRPREDCIYQAEPSDELGQAREEQSDDDQIDMGEWQSIINEPEAADDKCQPNRLGVDLTSSPQLLSQFVILDSATSTEQQIVYPQVYPFCDEGEADNNTVQAGAYDPVAVDNHLFQVYPDFKLQLINEVTEKELQRLVTETVKKSQLVVSMNSIRKINWQIREEKKPEIKNLRSKRYCRTYLLDHGNDFLVFDYSKFLLSPVREGTHIYLATRAIGYFSPEPELPPAHYGDTKYYLFSPLTGECFLETRLSGKWESGCQKFDIETKFSSQKIASCIRYVEEEQKERKEVIEVRHFDRFEKTDCEYLGIIENKISKFSEQWYCDSVIYLPKRKVYSKKVTEKDWEKLRIQLRLSESGTIVAELGIFDAKSSVTNCILFNESKSSQFMMGTIMETQHQLNYIMRISGVSPLMGFVTCLSRKLFVDDDQDSM